MKIRWFRRISAACLVLAPGLAQAAAQPRTFVSAKKGSDSANCSRTSPCRTFGRAIAVTTPGGEVIVLDSGGYGAVTISQAVSLEAPEGVYAGITVASGDGITVAAGTSDVVVLRGLTLVGAGTSGNGITVASAGTVHIEHCTIRGFAAGNGIAATQGVFLYLYVEDCQVSECNVGVNVPPTTLGQVDPSFAVISRSRFEGSQNWAILLQGAHGSNPIEAVVSECTLGGLFGGVSGGDSVALTVDRSVFAGFRDPSRQHFDVEVAGHATLGLTNSVTSQGGVAIFSPASACLFGNNVIPNFESSGTTNECPLQ